MKGRPSGRPFFVRRYHRCVVFVPPHRHLLRARDHADLHYAESIGVDDMAAAAGFSRAHFTREFRNAFGESPRAYLLTRRLERAATLLRTTDWTDRNTREHDGATARGPSVW